jgi:SAM-dependent methyltransferase
LQGSPSIPHFQILLEDKNCPLGCEREDELILVGRDRIHNLPGEFQVVKCRSCGLLRTNPRPTIDTIGLYYPDEYGPYQTTQVMSGAGRACWRSWAKGLISKWMPFHYEAIPALPPGRMLEIGCASGSYLHKMALKGWQVTGIEPSANAAARAQQLGYAVHVGSVEQAPDAAEPYDLVVGWMVLEHLHEPVDVLKKLHQWTRPGGWLALSVPDAGAKEFRFFKDAWYALQLPNHLYHYTPTTLRCMIRSTGWRPVKIVHQRVIGNLMVSAGYKRQDRGIQDKLTHWLLNYHHYGFLQYLFYPLGWLMAMMGQTGRMTIWARKDE